MWFKHRAWIPIAWALAGVNVVAVWFAAQPGEAWHATTHAALAVGCALGARYLTARQRSGTAADRLEDTMEQNEALAESAEEMQGRLLELEERVDFAERLMIKQRETERQDAPPRSD